MLKSIGQSFIDMALKIIEQQIQMIINGLIMKALGIATGTGCRYNGFGSLGGGDTAAGLFSWPQWLQRCRTDDTVRRGGRPDWRGELGW